MDDVTADLNASGSRSTRRVLSATIAACFVAIAGCTSGSDAEPPVSEPDAATSTAEQPTGTDPFDLVDDPDSGGSSSQTGDSAPSATPDTGRISFDGVTFEFTDDVVAGILPSRAEPLAEPPSDTSPSPVIFTFERPDGGHAVLSIEPARDPSGSYYPRVDDARRSAFDSIDTLVEQRADADNDDPAAASTRAVAFVNGAGVRTLVTDDGGDSTTYQVVGRTEDGRYYLEFDAAQIALDDVNALDEMIESVFVDVSSDALNDAACVDRAELVSNATDAIGTELSAGDEFVTTWQIRNVGTCTWDESYSWAFGGGDSSFEVIELSDVVVTAPGETLDFNLTLKAPFDSGPHAAQWVLTAPDGLQIVSEPLPLLVNVLE